jgi:hypothetical protein
MEFHSHIRTFPGSPIYMGEYRVRTSGSYFSWSMTPSARNAATRALA